MKKTLIAFLAICLLLVGCSAGSPTGAEGFLFTEKDGYSFDGAPYGCTVEELEKALGCTLHESINSPVNSPFEYTSYVTDSVTRFGIEGYYDAQFTEDGFYSLTFNAHENCGDVEALYADTTKTFTDAFGEPDDSKSEDGLKRLRWNDENSGTLFQLALYLSADGDQLKIGVTKPPFPVE